MAAASAASAAPRVLRNKRAEVSLPVARVTHVLRRRVRRVAQVDGAVYLTGIANYLFGEMLAAGAKAAHVDGKKRITLRTLSLGIADDEELAELLFGGGLYSMRRRTFIPEAGVRRALYWEDRKRTQHARRAKAAAAAGEDAAE